MLLAAGDAIPDLSALAPALLAPVGTALGAVTRDWLVRGARGRLARADLGLAAAQVAACFVAGLCAGREAMVLALCVAGFAGGLSTWSSLAVETVGWWRERRWGLLALHLPGVLAASMAAFLAGRALGGGAA
ncbi:MAG: CrcB family protein [Planctomycetota bacterium]|nr:CrcB family protein [Planctomycetota bacterium]